MKGGWWSVINICLGWNVVTNGLPGYGTSTTSPLEQFIRFSISAQEASCRQLTSLTLCYNKQNTDNVAICWVPAMWASLCQVFSTYYLWPSQELLKEYILMAPSEETAETQTAETPQDNTCQDLDLNPSHPDSTTKWLLSRPIYFLPSTFSRTLILRLCLVSSV